MAHRRDDQRNIGTDLRRAGRHKLHRACNLALNDLSGRVIRYPFTVLNARPVCTLAVSLGGAELPLCHKATTVHSGAPREIHDRLGISDPTIRVSIGIEHVDNMIADVTQARSG